MGTEYHATCKECSHQFTLKKGGGFTWYQKVCDACGTCIDVPRKGPEAFDGTMSREQLIDHLANAAGWSRRGGAFEPSELTIIDEITGRCSCGGNMVPEWQEGAYYRCPKCKGMRLALIGGGIAYD